ncbi:hypothetical protein ACFXJO_41425 [Streptomyces lavendulae]|uniref:hypothetical protein n=1 Tax=Streptomyces lavendulae TaxID=1914 RepID=UPI00368C7DCE
MPELLAALFSLLAQAAAAVNPVPLVRGRRRRGRLADHARGRAVRVPCDLRDRGLTAGQWREGHLTLPPGGADGPVRWQAKYAPVSLDARFPPLEPVSADGIGVAFRSEDGATELRLHPDEAPVVLRVLGGRP